MGVWWFYSVVQRASENLALLWKKTHDVNKAIHHIIKWFSYNYFLLPFAVGQMLFGLIIALSILFALNNKNEEMNDNFLQMDFKSLCDDSAT